MELDEWLVVKEARPRVVSCLYATEQQACVTSYITQMYTRMSLKQFLILAHGCWSYTVNRDGGGGSSNRTASQVIYQDFVLTITWQRNDVDRALVLSVSSSGSSSWSQKIRSNRFCRPDADADEGDNDVDGNDKKKHRTMFVNVDGWVVQHVHWCINCSFDVVGPQ